MSRLAADRVLAAQEKVKFPGDASCVCMMENAIKVPFMM